ncbi:MAG TPA: TraB/GumN family protein, partial [Candidatus Berkiella sp.]|nr:TraB/GumN family protein [Candidatus Berkiella sp.]
MSLQFTPHFAQQKIAPFIVEALQTTVQYPLLYRVIKGNQVHHLLGHIHAIPLAFMPEYVLQTIQHCQCLLTEGFATLPQDFINSMQSENPFYEGYTTSFTRPLNEEAQARFQKDIHELLDIFSLPNHQSPKLENLSITFLSTLFEMFIQNRVNAQELIIDTGLIQDFKQPGKSIIELNEPSKKLYMQYCQAEELNLKQYLKSSGEEYYKTTTRLRDFAELINQHYSSMGQADLLQNETVKNFLEKDIEKEEVTLDVDILEQVKIENQLWLRIFLSEHNQGTNNMLLACGYNHLLIPEQGLLRLLAKEGFSIER